MYLVYSFREYQNRHVPTNYMPLNVLSSHIKLLKHGLLNIKDFTLYRDISFFKFGIDTCFRRDFVSWKASRNSTIFSFVLLAHNVLDAPSPFKILYVNASQIYLLTTSNKMHLNPCPLLQDCFERAGIFYCCKLIMIVKHTTVK